MEQHFLKNKWGLEYKKMCEDSLDPEDPEFNIKLYQEKVKYFCLYLTTRNHPDFTPAVRESLINYLKVI
jgi:hypothetical protein